MAGTNTQLAALFKHMAAVTEVLGGDRFRINAFSRATRVLGEMVEDVALIGPDVPQLTAIEGLGKGTAQRVAEFLRTGHIKEHDELLAKVPPGLLGLLDIPGLGPKTVSLLWKQAGIEGVEGLRRQLRDDRLARLPGLGAKKLEGLRKNLVFAQAAGHRVRLGQALPVAEWLVGELGKVPGVSRAVYAGSLRRGRETIGDVDVLVVAEAKNAKAVSDTLVGLGPVESVLAQGPTKTSVRVSLPGGGADQSLQVDLRVVDPAEFGAAWMYFTGSKEHNVAMRQRAIEQGYKLSEYGLYEQDRLVAGRSEQEVFTALGLDWVPPELREAHDELALAQDHRLPKLIQLTDVQAELHAHTSASDGHWSIRELALAAVARGFHTVAVTDHSRSQPIANGLSAERLEQHIRDVRAVAQSLRGTIRVLVGSEVDILADGSLDYPDDLLAQLDLVVASPHSALSQDPAKATERLIRAIQNPYIKVLGHPTGRLINRRQGLEPDMKRVIAAAAERGIALEINANHWRLDLRDTHARAAIGAGVKLAINTDAHGPADLDQLRYGILTARRAGATKLDVINCLSQNELQEWLLNVRRL